MRKVFAIILLWLACVSTAHATDVVINGTTIPQNYMQGLPPEVRYTCTVTTGFTIASCNGTVRSDLVGKRGFTIEIDSVRYQVASVAQYTTPTTYFTITIDGDATPDYPGYITTGGGLPYSTTVRFFPYMDLRLYVDQAFQPYCPTPGPTCDGAYVAQSAGPGQRTWYRRWAVSLINEQGGTKAYLPKLRLPATTDGVDINTARYSAAFYNNDALLSFYGCFESFALPPVTPTTWPAICTYNRAGGKPPSNTTSYTKPEIDNRFPSCSINNSLYTAVTGNVFSCLGIGSGLEIVGGVLRTTSTTANHIRTITQPGHGLAPTNPIYNDAVGNWVLARSDDVAKWSTGIVLSVQSSSVFTAAFSSGIYDVTHGLTNYTIYYLGDGGGLTATAGTSAGPRQPILETLGSTEIHYFGLLQNTGGGVTVANNGATLPKRTTLDLLIGLQGADRASTATELQTSGVPTGFKNLVTDYNASGDGLIYLAPSGWTAGNTSLTISTSTTSVASIHPRPIVYGSTGHTFRVGQGIRLINGGSGGTTDHVTTVTAVNGNVLTLAIAPLANGAANAKFSHDDTTALQNALNARGRLYLPEGRYLHSSQLSLPTNSEALNEQTIIEGAGKWRSMVLFTGNGSGWKQANNLFNLQLRSLGIYAIQPDCLECLNTNQAGNGLELFNEQYSGDGLIPQGSASNLLIDNVLFLGWGRWSVFGDNVQSSQFKHISSYYQQSGAVGLVSTISVRGTSQTEPNANVIEDALIQYGRAVSNNERTVTDAVTTAGGANVTSATASFTSADLRKIVRIDGAQVNGAAHYGMITVVVNSTTVTLSARPYTTGAGRTMVIYPTSVANVYVQNGHNTAIRGGTYQGNWSGYSGRTHALWIENSDSASVDGLWTEDSGGTAGAAVMLDAGRGVTLKNTHLNASTNLSAPIDVGHGYGLWLRNTDGVTVLDSYIGCQNTSCVRNDSARGLRIDGTHITDNFSALGVYNSPWPTALGPGVSSLSTNAFRNTQNLIDPLLGKNSLSNGSFLSGTTGWTVVDATRYSLVTPSPYNSNRYERYLLMNAAGGANSDGNDFIRQAVSIPNSTPSGVWTVAFDWYLQDRGPQSISTAPRYDTARIAVDTSPSGTASAQEIVFTSYASVGLPVGKWQRYQMQFVLPAGTSRTITVRIGGSTGSNTGVWRFANFRLQPGTMAVWEADEPVTDERGGQVRAILNLLPRSGSAGETGTLKLWNLANTAGVSLRAHDTSTTYTITPPSAPPASTQCLQMDSSGNVTATGSACGAGGGGSIGGSIANTQIAVGSGANTIAGSANFTWTSAAGLTSAHNVNGGPALLFSNTSVGASAQAIIAAQASTAITQVYATSSGFTPTGLYKASQSILEGLNTTELLISVPDASGKVVFGLNGTEYARLNTTALSARAINPQTDNTYDLGTTSLRWKTLHLGPGSVVVHNDAANTAKVTLGFSGATAQVVTDATTPLQLTTGANNGIQIDTSGNIVTNGTLKVPVSAGAAPTTSGLIAYDSTSDTLEFGSMGTNRTVVTRDATETLSNKTLVTPIISPTGWASATHDHSAANAGGQLNASTVFSSGAVPMARGGTGGTAADFNANGAVYFNGTKLVSTATGSTGDLCLISSNGGAPTFSACAGSAGTALSAVAAATTTNTINSGDNAIIWKWTLTTTDKTGFRFSENTASAAGGIPHLIAVDTLSTSTVNPLQVTAQGTTNGVRVNTSGQLVAIGSGSIVATALNGVSSNGLQVRTAASTFTSRTIQGTTNVITVTNGDGASGDPTLNVGSLVVLTNQANTWSTGAQDFSAATSLKVPLSAGAAPTTSGLIAYDSTANVWKAGVNGAGKTFLMTDGTGATNGQLSLGVASTTTGQVRLFSSGSSTTTAIAAGAAASSLTFVWPATDPAAGQLLTAGAPAAGVVTLTWTSPLGASSTPQFAALGLGEAAPAAGLELTGKTLDNSASGGTVAAADMTWQVTKNNATAATFYGQLIKPTLNTGVSNANTTLNVLAVDTANTATTGLTTNLLNVLYGGTSRLRVTSAGSTYLAVNDDASVPLFINVPGTAVSSNLISATLGSTDVFKVNADGSATLGQASALTGKINLFNSGGTTATSISAGNAGSTLNYVLPTVAPTAGQILSAAAPSGGNVTLSWANDGGGGGAPTDALYVTLSTNATLTNERVLTGTTNQIAVADNGAGGTVVLSTPQDIATTSTPRWLRLGLNQAADAVDLLTLAVGTVTASTRAIASTATWNSGAATFVHELHNVTDTASAAASLLFDYQVGGASKGKLIKSGVLDLATGLRIAGAAASGSYLRGDGTNFVSAAIQAADITSGQLAAARGGTGLDTSGSTGVLRVSGGTWSANAGISHLAASTSADLAGVISDETGSGALVFGTSPTITGGAHTALTGLGIRSTGTGAFDLTLANSENLTAGRTLTLAVNDAARTLTVAGNATVSGTNTGDQTITLTGDVTGSGTGSFAATIANGAVSNAKLANSSITIQGSAVSLGGTTLATNATPQFARLGLNQAADGTASLAATQTALGTTSTDGLILQNTTAAASGVQQISPRLRMSGQGFKTDVTAASQTVDWIMETVPVQGAANPTSYLRFASQVNGGGYTSRAALLSNGSLGLGTTGPGAQLEVYSSTNSSEGVLVTNANAGTTAEAVFVATSSVVQTRLLSTSSGYTTSGLYRANQTALVSNGGIEMLLGVDDSSGNERIVFALSGSEKGRLNSSGLRLAAGSYLNLSATSGTSGYGVRDNSGVVEYKSSGGNWAPIGPNTDKHWLPAAACNNASAGTLWDLPTSAAAAPACVTGTNIQKGVLDFADTGGAIAAQNTLALPADFTGAIDVVLYWTTTATTGNAKWSVATAFTATNATETDDPTFNTASTVTTAAPGTANRVQSSAITSVTATGAGASKLFHIKVSRDGADAADTIGATARLVGVEVTVRRQP